MLAIALLASGAAGACNNDERGTPSVHTEHLTVFSLDDQRACSGTAPMLEHEVERLARAMKLELPDERINVVFGANASAEYCEFSEPVAGCAGHDEAGRLVAAGGLDAITHELVHAIRLANHASGPSFYEEGLAELFRAGEIMSYQVGTPGAEADAIHEAQLEEVRDPVDYIVAGNFVSWMHSTMNASEFAAAFASPSFYAIDSAGELESWSVSALGMPISATEDAWLDTLPQSYYFSSPCEETGLPVLTEGDIVVSDWFRCGDGADVIGPFDSGAAAPYAKVRSTCANIAGLATFSLEFDAPADARLRVVVRECGTGRPLPEAAQVIQGSGMSEVAVDACYAELTVESSSFEDFEYSWFLRAQP